MKVVMEVPIIMQGGPRPTPHLEVDLPFAPHIDMPVWHIAWKDSRKVKGIALQFDLDNEPSLIITLEPEHASSVEEQEQLLEQYKGHGWVV
jgi:hypothetical protein